MNRLQVSDRPYRHETLMAMARQYATEKLDIDPFTFIDYSGARPTDIPLSYTELDRRAQQVAALLQTRALPGQRVLLLYPSSLDYLCAFFGCLYASMIAVPVYPPVNLRLENRLAAVAEDCSPAIALTTTTTLESIGPRSSLPAPLARLPWLATDGGIDGFEFLWNEPKSDRDCVAFLQYTSGSTGRPKGVMVTHGNLLHNLYTIALHVQFRADDHHLTWLPPYHDMGLIGAMLGSFAAGVPLSFMTPAAFLRRPERWLREISSRRCTVSGGPNFAYELCLEKISESQAADLDLSSWNLAFSGAEPVRPDTLKRFARRFAARGFDQRAFYPCYGMAETTLFVTGVDRSESPVIFRRDDGSPIVSCGTAADGMSVEIVDPETGRVLPDRSVGEIWVKSLSVTAGYWNRETETRDSFEGTSPDMEGHYLRTGDLGFKHNGELYIHGRLKDLIIVRGVNYYPQDIETTVSTCHEAIGSGLGVAFSVDRDSEEKLIFAQEIGRQNQERAKDILAAIRKAIADGHDLQPHEILLVEKGCVPKTTSGKLCRQPCRERYLRRDLPVIAAWTNPTPATEPIASVS
jgi:acyl-CoA synthetase (AMP-forming)/AMP-acid ligase II